ncbi:ferritin [Cytophagaceae bacterium ABcell3]|nr:ferritin [Cytophagaceae bacterium ABcell3]
MKDLLRLRTSLTEEIENLLNEQVKREAVSSSAYLAMASWCDQKGYDYSADHFYKQSGEEREHMLKLFKYINDVGGKAISPDLPAVQQDFESLKSVFETALEHEISITQSINMIVDRCYKAKDFTTVNFLQWFLNEQIEEEYIARRALELFDVIGEEGVGTFMIDKQVKNLKYEG